MRYFAGIDAGVSGALAVISEDLTDISIWDWPDDVAAAVNLIEDILDLENDELSLVALEKQQAAPFQKASTGATQMENYGMWQGILATARVPYVIVSPKAWQYKIFDSIKRKDDLKLVSVSHASRRFPQAPIGKNHNRADATNIALYARKVFLEG